MPLTDSLPLLCLSGSPALHHPQQPSRPLPLRYHKGLALLGFLAAHAERVFRRETLANLLWPDIDTPAGRANLRVVLADLSQSLKQLGLESVLEVQRDWLALRPAGKVQVDITALGAHPPPGHWHRQWLEPEQTWLDKADDGTSEDFREWLAAQRQHIAARRQAWCAPLAPDDTRAADDAAPQISLLTLLRVELGLPLEHEAAMPSWHRPERLGSLRLQARFFGGQLIEHDESGLTFAFGLDNQHTGQRWQALRCACSLPSQLESPLTLSMGITAGRTLVQAGTPPVLMGWRKRLVTRLALSAEPGEIVCDDSLLELVQQFQFRDLGRRHFRGLNQEMRLYGRPLADMPPLMLPPGGDFSGSFFARADQLKKPLRLLSGVRPGQPAGLCLSAEPGAGKTRLAWEFAQRVQREGGLAFWISAVPEAQNVPWRGLHDFFSKLLSGGGAEPLERIERQLQAHLGEPARQAILGLLHHQGVAQSQQAALAEGISTLLRGPGQRQVLVVVDDVQWLDQPSAAVLNRVIQRADAVLWLLTRRQGEANPLQITPLLEETLPPLDDQAAAAILNSLPDADLLSPEARQGRIVNARGLPLYLLADSVPQESGSHFSEFCQALLNRLGAARSAMEAAAVLGMLFQREDLAALCGAAAAEQACDIAQACGLLVNRGEQQLSFFHPRLREYLLSVQAPAQRRAHASTAAQRLQGRGEHAAAALLWEQADALDDARRAWLQAALRARHEDDLSAACSHCARLGLLGYLDGPEGVQAQLLHAHCVIARDGYGASEAHRVLQALRPEPALLAQLDADTRFNVQMLTYLGSSSQGHPDGLAHAEALQASAKTPAQAMTASWAMGNTLFWLGSFEAARDWLLRCVATAQTLSPRERMQFFPSDLLVFAQAELGWVLWLLGEAARARQALDTAIAQADESPTAQDRCIAHAFHAFTSWNASELERAQPSAAQALAVAEAENYVFWQSVAGLLLCLCHAHQGQPVDLAALRRDADTMLGGYRAGTTTALWLAAGALLAAGQLAEAQEVLQQALQASEHYEHRYCRMDLWRLRGLAWQAQGDAAQARACLTQARQLGRQAGARGWLRHWQDQLGPAT